MRVTRPNLLAPSYNILIMGRRLGVAGTESSFECADFEGTLHKRINSVYKRVLGKLKTPRNSQVYELALRLRCSFTVD